MDKKAKSIPSGKLIWHPTIEGIAAVSGIFSLIVAGLLMINYVADQSGLPEKELIYSSQLAKQKALLTQDPQNEQLKKEIRALDYELRQDFFWRKTFSEKGKLLLLAGIAVFLLAMKKLADLQRKPHKPQTGSREPNFDATKRRQARQAVSWMGLILTVGILSLALAPKLDIPALPSDDSDASVVSVPEYPTDEEIQQNWPRFRGPGGLGISIHERAPTSWNGETGEGILWKAEVHLPGANSPIAWGDRVFISGADKKNKEVYCYSLESGDLLWRNRVENVPGNPGEVPSIMEDTGYAAPTMVCDGARVYAIFADGDLICFDFSGKRIWAKNLGAPDNVYGYASSLSSYRNLLLIQYDGGTEDDDQSVLYALEGKTGQVVWQAKRPVANTWTSPILADTANGKQFITCSEPWVIAYEPETGAELWRANLMGTDLAPSPIFAREMAFVIQPNETLFAIRCDGRGDVTETHVAWKKDCPTPDISSPVSNGEFIFLLDGAGVLTCYETQNGEMVWDHRFDDFFLTSPSIAAGWIYLVSDNGKTYRVKAAREFEQADSISTLDETIMASPAFLDGRIIIRGDKNLYCIGSN
jgi:outer membrane protein assembly factor BamB